MISQTLNWAVDLVSTSNPVRRKGFSDVSSRIKNTLFLESFVLSVTVSGTGNKTP